ncbi:HD domain-containing protein [uncultured Ruegeria sp.]|uniref:HD domain-containing protein n=1 Tax=uncultured Ruegeria sp. TaxID=259304 RepID=UPI002633D215|nr:HD domain-containing protein [uncultured Ruegeria sp.]
MAANVRSTLRGIAESLTREIDSVCQPWLEGLHEKLSSENLTEFQPKQVNDPIWGTIELLPWEVALLDTPFIQRLRSVRQLGLAQLVFPGANHGRLEHSIGVIGALEEATRALGRQVERWNIKNPNTPIGKIDTADRYAVRLAGLFHDVGHGPFSHALEPVLDVSSPLEGTKKEEGGWRSELPIVRKALSDLYSLNKIPSSSVAIAVMMVLSEPLHKLLESSLMSEIRLSGSKLEERIVAAIVGAVEGPGASFFSALVSSQLDADRMDYLARDAHHAGLEIGFDTQRLLAKLEILRVREENLHPTERELRDRAIKSDEGTFLQLGIAASGFGSFEQMLIGRTFLYDRLYHHHKVRAAEAMAQRLMLVAERDRGKRFTFREIFLGVGDETMLRIFSREVQHSEIETTSEAAASLASRILERDLLHRAYAFRGRFIATPNGYDAKEMSATQNESWLRVVKSLETLESRYALGNEIYDLASEFCEVLSASRPHDRELNRIAMALAEIGPEHVIVDLPESKTEGIRLLARYPNGALRVPEFSFNPQKWAEAYDLQKRTGYVFCPKSVAPIIGMAAKTVFLKKFGVVMAQEADGYIKADPAPDGWTAPIIAAGIIDQRAADLLKAKRHSLLPVREDDVGVPNSWLKTDPDLATKLSIKMQDCLHGGLTAEDMHALRKVLSGLFAFVDEWFTGDYVTSDLASERELQKIMARSLRASKIGVDEGTEVSGGELDLYAERAILIENKFSSKPKKEIGDAPGVQGRRYAISLSSQVVIVVSAAKAKASAFPDKTSCVSVCRVAGDDLNRVEIRFDLPFGAVTPSSEKTPNR